MDKIDKIDEKLLDGPPKKIGLQGKKPVYQFRTKGGLYIVGTPKKNNSNTDLWKDEAYFEVKSKNALLEKELERLWQMVQHLTGGAKPNFRKALDLTDFPNKKAFKAHAYS
jgi:hypothetical protein